MGFNSGFKGLRCAVLAKQIGRGNSMTVIHLERLSSGPTKKYSTHLICSVLPAYSHVLKARFCNKRTRPFIIVRNGTYITAVESVGPRFR